MKFFKPQWIKERGKQAGFTLVELMVSLTLFVIVVIAAVSSLYTVNGAARKVEAMRSVLDNLNFAIESMSRTIRTGDTFICGGSPNRPAPPSSGAWNCPFDISTGDYSFMVHTSLERDPSDPTKGLDVEYKQDVSANGTTYQIFKRTSTEGTGNWGNWYAITAPEIDVQQFHIYVDGSDPDDQKQPLIMLSVQGVATAGTENIAPFSVQTLISQRNAE